MGFVKEFLDVSSALLIIPLSLYVQLSERELLFLG